MGNYDYGYVYVVNNINKVNKKYTLYYNTGGGYSGHLMNPSAEVLEGLMYWNHMIMENYGNFVENYRF